MALFVANAAAAAPLKVQIDVSFLARFFLSFRFGFVVYLLFVCICLL